MSSYYFDDVILFFLVTSSCFIFCNKIIVNFNSLFHLRREMMDATRIKFFPFCLFSFLLISSHLFFSLLISSLLSCVLFSFLFSSLLFTFFSSLPFSSLPFFSLLFLLFLTSSYFQKTDFNSLFLIFFSFLISFTVGLFLFPFSRAAKQWVLRCMACFKGK